MSTRHHLDGVHSSAVLQEAVDLAEGKEKVEKLNLLAESFGTTEPEQTASYALEALELAKALGDRKGEARSLNTLARGRFSLGETQVAIQVVQEALHLSKEEKDNEGIAYSLFGLGVFYRRQGLFYEAIGHLQEAKGIYQTLGNLMRVANCCNNLGLIYWHLGEFDQSLQLFFRSLKLLEPLESTDKTLRSKSHTLNNIGLIYKEQAEYQVSLKYYQESLLLKKKQGHLRGVASSYLNIGDNYTLLEEFENAEKHYTLALELAKETGDQELMARALTKLGGLFSLLEPLDALAYTREAMELWLLLEDPFERCGAHVQLGKWLQLLGQNAEAILETQKGLELAVQIKALRLEANASGQLAQLYELEGEYQKALKHTQRQMKLEQMLFAETKSKTIAELQTRHEVERKEREAEIYRLKTQELEQRVTERTEALERAKDELEKEVQKHKLTALQLAETLEVAESANRTKNTFLAMMSHELRTPLNAIIGYAEMLQEDAEDDGLEEMAEDLVRIQVSARRLLTLLSNLLEFAHVESGSASVERKSFDVKEFFDELQPMLVYLATRNNNRFTTSFPEDMGMMESDEQRVRQVIMYLLDNAGKFTQDGEVSLKVFFEQKETPDGMLCCEIRDTGIGFSPEQLENMFKAFTQNDLSSTRPHDGAGLGLTLCQKWCVLLKGEIRVESVLGEGSSFVVKFPLR